MLKFFRPFVSALRRLITAFHSLLVFYEKKVCEFQFVLKMYSLIGEKKGTNRMVSIVCSSLRTLWQERYGASVVVFVQVM